MRTLPREIVLTAARTSSPHFEDHEKTIPWEDCPVCRVAYDRAHYAAHGALELIAEHIAQKIEAVDPVEWALAGQRAGQDAAAIVRMAFAEEKTDV